jgi:hypothetical protein
MLFFLLNKVNYFIHFIISIIASLSSGGTFISSSQTVMCPWGGMLPLRGW